MMKRALAIMLGSVVLAAAALAADAVAVLTELQVKRGQVHVRPSGESAWQPATPLQSLRVGDQVRVTGEGRAVIVFTGAAQPTTVTQANSPFSVTGAGADTMSDRARAVVSGVTDFLLGQQRGSKFQSLSVRSVRVQPDILVPRETKIARGPLTFEWSGPDRALYRVRLIGPAGVVWEQGDLARLTLAYPAQAPALTPGARYTWELESQGSAVQRAQFEVMSAAESKRVQEALGLLAPATRGYPPATVALLKSGLLFKEALYADARRELLAGIAASPEEPTLHALLAEIYDRTGLRNLARQEAEEAERLSKGP
jgi:hypothetical protein